MGGSLGSTHLLESSLRYAFDVLLLSDQSKMRLVPEGVLSEIGCCNYRESLMYILYVWNVLIKILLGISYINIRDHSTGTRSTGLCSVFFTHIGLK